MQTSKSRQTPSLGSPEFMQLKDFLLSSALSYTTYRRLRLAKKTPKEYKLSAKTILLKVSDVAKWSANPTLKPRRTPTAK